MSTPTEVTALARRWRLEVNMGTDETPDWQLCPGVVDFQPAAEPNFEDGTAYESDGWTENTKTAQSWQVTATINRKINDQVKVYHPVHEAIRLAWLAFGSASEVPIRYMDRNGMPEAYEGKALVNWAPSGGEYTALDQVEVTFTGTGPLTPITNPLAA
ncbi:phage tail tube protein [Streptomyces sp. PR69]|uniref:phage tail tube protein n=1 Tax=Streptomyces sp. PR69 TaxID=2984950 RepID=UPI002264217D|nr:hypothetical protein [Streptomyces sp. PR69]